MVVIDTRDPELTACSLMSDTCIKGLGSWRVKVMMACIQPVALFESEL